MSHTNSNSLSKEHLTDDFKAVVLEAEQLLQSATDLGTQKASDIRASIEQSLATAREELQALQKAATDAAASAVHATDDYVHANPWRAIGIAAAVSVSVGALIGLSINRR